ncbi:putative vacuolar ATP synthase subunit G [Acaromyces ingoldii]|uniref:V-type proton ATPase subunit G n=1 Tax=Acaromyces ingoldii TaxID=215250 RepID=A0A316Z2A5_9BASI|nr:putative vacuolar ATP synthase subunit G [Acaromyces ingoldii]PWN94315.1 putative vacuolar ATP synthase subunit G [Acaromyces ingoldii]
MDEPTTAPDAPAAQQSQGIQTLLEAEKEAAKIVQKARTYRTQKLKDARTEAAKDIEELKKKTEADFQKFQKEHEGSQSTSQTAVDKETEEKLETINKAFEQNRSKVVDKLLDRVTEVKAELHRNLKKEQA